MRGSERGREKRKKGTEGERKRKREKGMNEKRK